LELPLTRYEIRKHTLIVDKSRSKAAYARAAYAGRRLFHPMAKLRQLGYDNI